MIRTILRRTGIAALGALFTVPFVTAPASAAEVTVPGCYGVEPTIYCDITVEVTSPYAVGTNSDSIEVCLSVCTQVPIVLAEVEPTGTGQVCVSYVVKSTGATQRTCRTLDGSGVDPQPWLDYVDQWVDSLDEYVDAINELRNRYSARVCRTTYGEYGAYVYDRYTGETVVNGCFSLAEPTICRQISWGFEVQQVDVCGL